MLVCLKLCTHHARQSTVNYISVNLSRNFSLFWAIWFKFIYKLLHFVIHKRNSKRYVSEIIIYLIHVYLIIYGGITSTYNIYIVYWIHYITRRKTISEWTNTATVIICNELDITSYQAEFMVSVKTTFQEKVIG